MVLRTKPFVAGPRPNPFFANPSESNPIIWLLNTSTSSCFDWDAAASLINVS